MITLLKFLPGKRIIVGIVIIGTIVAFAYLKGRFDGHKIEMGKRMQEIGKVYQGTIRNLQENKQQLQNQIALRDIVVKQQQGELKEIKQKHDATVRQLRHLKEKKTVETWANVKIPAEVQVLLTDYDQTTTD